MHAIKDILGRKSAKFDGVGIELETEFESQQYPNVIDVNWVVKEEGSLRGTAAEYVSNGPLAVDDSLFKKINNLCAVVNTPLYAVRKDSPRTSVHVHVNTLELTPVQLLSFGISYWIIENALFNYCGEKRKNNLFCLRLCDAEGVTEVLKRATSRSGELFYGLSRNDRIRYCGVNWNAVPKFGTLEFRGMRGTTDPKIIHTWATELYGLRNRSKIFSDPSDVLDRYANVSKEQFLKLLVSEEFAKTLMDFKDWSDGMDENVETLCELAYSQRWSKWNGEFKSSVPPKEAPRAAVWEDEIIPDPLNEGIPANPREMWNAVNHANPRRVIARQAEANDVID